MAVEIWERWKKRFQKKFFFLLFGKPPLLMCNGPALQYKLLLMDISDFDLKKAFDSSQKR